MALDVDYSRSQFPSLASGFIFGDNAGGSQCLKSVADKVYDYLINTNVQLGADYSVSVTSTTRVASGAITSAQLMNSSPEEIVFASSSTMAIENVARAMESDVLNDEEFILTGEHEGNASAWKKLAKRKGLTVKIWPHTRIPGSPQDNPYAVGLHIDALLPLISSKTRLVAFPAASNILGTANDVEEIIRAIRQEVAKKGARKVEVSVDCVAYAPHRKIDVKKWDVDYAVFSYYKVYGPHTACLYVRSDALKTSLTPLTHHFLSVEGTSYQLQPGGQGYELVYALTAVLPYFLSLSSTPSPSTESNVKAALDDAFNRIEIQEHELMEPLLAFLRSKKDRGVFIIGDEENSPSRVPTISFVVKGDKPISSKQVVEYFDKQGDVGIRWGHFYAYTLCADLEPPLPSVDEGVVRISFVHYNTVQEVQKVIAGLEEILSE